MNDYLSIAIDSGTTNSAMAWYAPKSSEAEVIVGLYSPDDPELYG